MGIAKSERKSAKVLQWIGRILGIILSLGVLFIFVGNLIPGSEDPEIDPDRVTDTIPTIIIVIIWMVFFIIAWFNELVGGIGTIIWAIIWIFPIYFTSGNNKMGMFLILPSPFLLVGLLFLFALYLEETYQKKKT